MGLPYDADPGWFPCHLVAYFRLFSITISGGELREFKFITSLSQIYLSRKTFIRKRYDSLPKQIKTFEVSILWMKN